jgi:hypothetical protein
MQAKDIAERPILEFLRDIHPRWATWARGWDHSIPAADSVPAKVLRAKMTALIRRKLVSGCTCGCRGDYEITELGRQFLGG